MLTRRRLGWTVVAVVAVVAAVATPTTILLLPGPRHHPKTRRPAFERMPAVAATFLAQSYAPGAEAELVLWKPQRSFTVQFFRVDATTHGWSNTTMQGTAVSPVYPFGATSSHRPIDLPIGDWPTGLYYAQLSTGRLTGYAIFVVRPRRLGQHRVLVVMPSYTWQAYNFRDDNHDGLGDTWYDGGALTVDLERPFMARGVPPHFTRYDLPFLNWLAETGKEVDFATDGDLDRVGSGAALHRAYTLIVFPGHDEYVTAREYDAVTGYRNLGGHLMFLSADAFYWRVALRNGTITRTGPWRDLGRPEASLVGIQLAGNDRGAHEGPWHVVDATRWPWMFAGLQLGPGGTFGSGGIEISHVAPGSPPGTTVLAEIPGLIGGSSAQMTYYETPAGAKVFAAGAFTLAGSRDPNSRRLLQNLWDHLAPPAARATVVNARGSSR